MSLSATTSSATPPPSAPPETHLYGRWLLMARAGWIVLTVLVLTLSAIAIPKADALLQSVCQPGVQCFPGAQLTPAELLQIQQAGLSPGFVAAYQIAGIIGITLIHAALAALIFWRRPSDRMALLCAYMLVLLGGATYTGLLDYGLRTVAPVWYWLVGGLELAGQVAFPTFFLLFPSGWFVPRWTRWGVLVFVLDFVWHIFIANAPLKGQGGPDALVFAVLILGLVGVQVYRYRRVSTFRERQQTKWVVFGFAAALGVFALFLIIANTIIHPVVLKNWTVVGNLILQPLGNVLLLLIPISIAIAILRSRLYDIDTLINKALVYGLLTGLLGGLYAGLIIGLESLAGLFSGQAASNPLVLVISTLAIAALFLPARRRIQNLIDRRLYRKKYDAAKTLEAFAATLRQETDLEQIRAQLIAVVQETMQPAHVSLWLRQPESHHTERGLGQGQ
ncbi:MAG TPA: hypothetical protein VKT82_00920 [Ktedonobacterales bacterium]|nr:hypothetical protein [Ktedonobacterales bacterium]